jgi:hypothetical protein
LIADLSPALSQNRGLLLCLRYSLVLGGFSVVLALDEFEIPHNLTLYPCIVLYITRNHSWHAAKI